MATITTRSGKGSALTHTELDNNFTNLNTDKVEASGDTITGNLDFNDNVKARFGAGQDLQIYHDGSNSYIDDAGTGALQIRSNGLYLQKYTNENMVRALADGAVSLYYDNAIKLDTTSTGIDVTGTVVSDGLTVDGTVDVNLGSDGSNIASLSGASAGRKLDIQSFVVGASAGAGYSINATSGQGQLDFQTAGNSRLNIDAGGDISFYEDTGTSPKMVWKSADERLGIGTDSPSAEIEISNTNSPQIRITDTGGTVTSKLMSDTTSGYVGTQTNHPFSFLTNNAVRMRIDSAGNLLVGKTGSSLTTVGSQLQATGLVRATTDGADVLQLNRKTSDGSIAVFYKDGTTVGSIGVALGNTYFAGTASGITFGSANVYPTNNTGSKTNGTLVLGHPNNRFKDLYLSGGAYLGGTAAANKLDDYEEGTFTPVLTTDNSDMTVSSYTNQDGVYTKVGDLVTIAISLQIGSFTSVGTGSLSITGLPFTPSTDGNFIFYGGSTFATNAGWTNKPDSMGVFGDANKLRLVKNNATMTATDLGGGSIWLRGALTYKTA